MYCLQIADNMVLNIFSFFNCFSCDIMICEDNNLFAFVCYENEMFCVFLWKNSYFLSTKNS